MVCMKERSFYEVRFILLDSMNDLMVAGKKCEKCNTKFIALLGILSA